MDCATEIRRIIQEIDRKTKTIFVNVTPARKCKLSSGITVNFHRREHTAEDGKCRKEKYIILMRIFLLAANKRF